MTKKNKNKSQVSQKQHTQESIFHLEFLNAEQKNSYEVFTKNDIVFFIGEAGSGKTFLSTAFALSSLLSKQAKKIVISRPIVEAGEKLGFLPGTFDEKVLPYMLPIYDTLDDLVGKEGLQRELVNKCLEVAPIAYLRGRAETLDSPIVTPNGIIPMGSIKVGDQVIGSNGEPINVIGVYPQGKKPIYKVNFSDKTFVKCSEDHLWSTMTLNEKRHNKGFTIKTTKEISQNIKNKYNQKVHRMPNLTGYVQFKEKDVSINPYLLGVLLGDGHIRDSAVRICTADEDILKECSMCLPENMKINHMKNYDYSIVQNNNIKKNNLCLELKKYGLNGKKSNNKFVPEDYKINSKEIRLEILRGLMDTDGSIFLEKRSNKIRMQYYTTSWQLAQDVMFLVRSLGGNAYYRKREFDESDNHEYKGNIIKHIHASYIVDVRISENPFKLKRKAKKFNCGSQPNYVKLISSIDYIGDEECQCIEVDSKDRLYVTNGFNITHNTFKNSIAILDEAQNATKTQLKLFLTRIGMNSKLLITGDPKQSDLGPTSGLMEVVEKLRGTQGIGIIEFSSDAIVRHPIINSIIKKI